MSSETFEQVFTAAQADGSFNAAWKKFVVTRFFVPVVALPGGDPNKFRLHTEAIPHGGARVHISEVGQRLEAGEITLAQLYGADVVRMLPHDAEIVIALSDRPFTIAPDRVLWLRKGIEASQAKMAAAKAQGAAAAVAPASAPAPVAAQAAVSAPAPAVAAAPAPAPAPAAAAPAPEVAAAVPTRAPLARSNAVLDVAALKPRPVTLPDLGLSLFVPGEWQESRSANTILLTDPATGTTVEVSGFHRPGMSLEQWRDLRLSLIRQEMRHLGQDGSTYAIDGDEWRDRVAGSATEFTGVFPGEALSSRYLLACVRVEGTLVTVAIKATEEVFEQQRAIFKWLLSRLSFTPSAPDPYQAPGASADGGAAYASTPEEAAPVFGLSLQGRIGRMRSIAYAFPLMAVAILVGIAAAVILPASRVLGGLFAGVFVLLLIWCSVRLLVLRMHDVNLSGKWLLALIPLGGALVATRQPLLIGSFFLLVSLGSMVLTYLWPGNADDNDYGPPPGPNPVWVLVVAGLCCLLQVVGIVSSITSSAAIYKEYVARGAPAPATPGPAAAPQRLLPFVKPWSPPDASFVVNLPRPPEEMPLPPMMRARAATFTMHQYRLFSSERIYGVQTFEYKRMTDREQVLNSLEGVVIGTEGTLVGKRDVVFENGAAGREIRVLLPTDKVRTGRVTVIGSTGVVVMVTAHPGELTDLHVAAVMESFQILPPPAEPAPDTKTE
ncbi:MAG TPA: DUF805 domain-containing protein [Telluria sp.]